MLLTRVVLWNAAVTLIANQTLTTRDACSPLFSLCWLFGLVLVKDGSGGCGNVENGLTVFRLSVRAHLMAVFLLQSDPLVCGPDLLFPLVSVFGCPMIVNRITTLSTKQKKMDGFINKLLKLICHASALPVMSLCAFVIDW